MNLEVTILGTAASAPTEHRGLPAIAVMAGGDRLLFDCGEGTQRQFMRNGGLPDLDAIFLTHYHLDHWFGLAGIVKSFDLREREKPLTIYGPDGLHERMKAVKALVGGVNYEINLRVITASIRESAVKFDGYTVVPFLVDHRKLCYGYALIEDEQPGRVDAAKAIDLGLTGPEIGRLTRGESVVVDGSRTPERKLVTPDMIIGPPRKGRRVVYSGDTRPTRMVEAMAGGADLLIHEATFTQDKRNRAYTTGHSTAHQAAEVFKAAGAENLVLTHLSSTTNEREALMEAREVGHRQGNVVVARDFMRMVIPVRDKGEPVLFYFAEKGK